MKTFESTQDIINDELFRTILKNNIDTLRSERNRRGSAKQGYKYIKDGFDFLIERGNFNFEYIIKNIEDIWCKQSSLSTVVRNSILYCCNKSYNEMIEKYKKHESLNK